MFIIRSGTIMVSLFLSVSLLDKIYIIVYKENNNEKLFCNINNKKKEEKMKKPVESPWSIRIGAFATAVGVPVNDVEEAFKSLVGEPGDEALLILSDKTAVPDEDIKTALAGFKIPSGKLNMHLVKLRDEKPVEEKTEVVSSGTTTTLSILPSIPDEQSFLEMLKTGGILKVGTTEVLSAIKAALAQTVGLYKIPEKILEKMEAFAMAQEEPCGEAYFSMQKLVTEKKYGDILSVMGVSGSYVSEARKKAFFERLDAKLWTALNGFQTRLVAWQQTWTQGMANPSMLIIAMTAQHGGAALPPGIMAPPDTADLHAAGEEVINEINRIFAGPGIPVARALAYDATRIMGILESKDLPAQVGSANKDQMIKDLGISVGSEIVRNEQSLTRYALAIMSLPKVAPGNDELTYLSAMLQLGATIPWEKLGAKGLGGRDLRQ